MLRWLRGLFQARLSTNLGWDPAKRRFGGEALVLPHDMIAEGVAVLQAALTDLATGATARAEAGRSLR